MDKDILCKVKPLDIKACLGKKGIVDYESLELKLNVYVADCNVRQVPLTMSGLALTLWIDRKMLLEYSLAKPLWYRVCEIREQIIQQNEEILSNKAFSTAWVSFRLKNNAWYSDKLQVEGNNNITLSLADLHKMRKEKSEQDWSESNPT